MQATKGTERAGGDRDYREKLVLEGDVYDEWPVYPMQDMLMRNGENGEEVGRRNRG